MFYFLSQFKDVFSGLNLFRYITFRTGMAAVTAFLLCLLLGPYFIKKLKQWKVQEVAKRADAPDLDKFQNSKEGTPTMGGIFVIGSILISVFLWADLSNQYILLTFFTCFSLALLGFLDDYTKLTQKVNIKQRGVKKRTKIVWQFFVAAVVACALYISPTEELSFYIPFIKDAMVNLGIFFIPFTMVVIIGSSNAVNLTDGLDGLAIGCVLIVSMTLAALSYIAGNVHFAEYLLIPFVSGAGELTVFCAALIGASLGFLWFNCHPASVFMGDTGSLALGGTLGAIAIFIKHEILLALMGGIFVIEALSVILQVMSFRLTGKRIFKMSPFHHHLQLSGWKESQIITRFWIIAVILALLTLTTLKIR